MPFSLEQIENPPCNKVSVDLVQGSRRKAGHYFGRLRLCNRLSQ